MNRYINLQNANWAILISEVQDYESKGYRLVNITTSDSWWIAIMVRSDS